MALQGAQRAAILTSRLLAFSRQQALDPRPSTPTSWSPTPAELLRRTLGEAIALETVLAGGLWRAFADPNQLENAILNLAVNARDAMPERRQADHRDRQLPISTRPMPTRLAEPVEAGQYVHDRGRRYRQRHGPERRWSARSSPSSPPRRSARAPGLGLSQVYGFVRQSGGHVRIYSEPGHGTTVKLYLPRHQGGDEHAPTAASAGRSRRAPSAARPSWSSRTTKRCARYAVEIAGRARLPRAARRRRRRRARHRSTANPGSTCCSPTW